MTSYIYVLYSTEFMAGYETTEVWEWGTTLAYLEPIVHARDTIADLDLALMEQVRNILDHQKSS